MDQQTESGSPRRCHQITAGQVAIQDRLVLIVSHALDREHDVARHKSSHNACSAPFSQPAGNPGITRRTAPRAFFLTFCITQRDDPPRRSLCSVRARREESRQRPGLPTTIGRISLAKRRAGNYISLRADSGASHQTLPNACASLCPAVSALQAPNGLLCSVG
jgi:hypothetical protein